MIRAGSLALVVAISAACSSGEGDAGPPTEAKAGGTEVRVQLLETSRSAEPGSTKDVRFRVEVPPNHHGYLDEGDDGFFIPFTFAFDVEGDEVVALARPEGARDEEVGATVLRGEGEFAFRLPGASSGASEATVRYQICNDSSGVCYAPSSVVVPLGNSGS